MSEASSSEKQISLSDDVADAGGVLTKNWGAIWPEKGTTRKSEREKNGEFVPVEVPESIHLHSNR